MATLHRNDLVQSVDARWVVDQAVRAPSIHNTQPWRFEWDGQRFAILADTSRGLTANDPDGRELVISCGAAVYNLRLALRKLGFDSRVTLMPQRHQPRTLATVDVLPGRPADADERRLFAALARRHTHRGAFEPRPIAADLAVRLQEAAEDEGAQLIYVSDPGQRARILHLSRAAERLLVADEDARSEVAAWTPPPASRRRDGVPAWAYPAAVAGDGDDLAHRDFDLDRGYGTLPPAPPTAGVVAVLATERDVSASWLTAGQALERVLVTAAERSAYAAIHSQATEVPHIRAEVQRELCTAASPQLLLRLGYADTVIATPRRPVADVLDIRLS